MFAKVFSQIFDSSISVNYQTRHVFMDMLVLADSDGVVDMTLDAIARRTNVPLETVTAAISDLSEADKDSRTPDEDGRRIIPIDQRRSWGWQIVNYAHYRSIRDEEARREYWRDYKRSEREAKRSKSGKKKKPKIKADKSMLPPASEKLPKNGKMDTLAPPEELHKGSFEQWRNGERF